MIYLAQGLQLIGIVEVGYGLFIGIFEGDISRELRFSAVGGVIFLIGWLIQKWKKGR